MEGKGVVRDRSDRANVVLLCDRYPMMALAMIEVFGMGSRNRSIATRVRAIYNVTPRSVMDRITPATVRLIVHMYRDRAHPNSSTASWSMIGRFSMTRWKCHFLNPSSFRCLSLLLSAAEPP